MPARARIGREVGIKMIPPYDLARARVDRPADLDQLEVTGTSTGTAVAGCRVDQPPLIGHLAEHGSKQGVDGKIG